MALYKRPNSKYWWMKFYFDGELIQQSTKCKSKADAQTVESAYRTELALGKVGIEPKREIPTFDKAVKDFLQWSKIEHAASSHARYFHSCTPLLKYFGKKKVNRITTEEVERFIIWRSNQKSRKTGELITRDTINRELCILKMIFRRLTDAKILRDSPTRTVKQLSENDKSFHVLTNEEEKLYLMASPQPLQDVATLMLETGMRCGEVYRIKRSEVYLDKDYLQVTKGKTKAAIRRVYLSGKAKKILSIRIARFDGVYLFPQNDIDHKSATEPVTHLHLKTVRKLGFSFRLYDCRHTFATRVLEGGEIDLLTLASMLGHATLKETVRYAHPSEKRKADAIKKMELLRSKVA